MVRPVSVPSQSKSSVLLLPQITMTSHHLWSQSKFWLTLTKLTLPEKTKITVKLSHPRSLK